MFGDPSWEQFAGVFGRTGTGGSTRIKFSCKGHFLLESTILY